MEDKFSAVWVSHSSISDFLKCPRSYYLKNVYKDPKTNHKIQVVTPPLALGQAVHEVLESLSTIPTPDRFNEPLIPKYEEAWKNLSGKKGGFFDADSERKYFERGKKMLARVLNNPGPLKNLAVKIKQDLPHYWLSKEENIILCGKIDWLEYMPAEDAVHIIDFKTSRSEEDPNSLQLPIYLLLVKNTQARTVAKASYWYLESSDKPVEKELPDLADAQEKVLKVAKQIKLARGLERFKCPHGGCFACRDFERILVGEGEFITTDSMRRDIYVLPPSKQEEEETSEII